MASTSAFYSDASSPMTRSSDHVTQPGTCIDPANLGEVYEITRCVTWIKNNAYKRVALQFPDSLLPDAGAVAAELERQAAVTIFILADTSYGSCCVDEVAADHYQADSIIHYGHSCLSTTQRHPVLYVFRQQPLDVTHCCSAFSELYPDTSSHVIIVCDVIYQHRIDEIWILLKKTYHNICRTKINNGIPGANSAQRSSIIKKLGRNFLIAPDKKIEDYNIFYIGCESLTLTNLIMTFNKCEFSTYDPVTRVGRRESVNVNRMLMRRYYLIERARDADIVGIIAGTLGVSDYIPAMDRLRSVIKAAGKKSYNFVMGKLNAPKMANFLEVDIYVLVACPENSLLDSSEFYRPVVTPFEMEMACNASREWTGEYVTEFSQILPGAESFVEMCGETRETDISLLTGGLRRLGQREGDTSEGDQSVVTRDDKLIVAETGTAGAFLAERSWTGLDPKLGQTPVVMATEGRRGIAAGYTHEPGT